MFGTLQLGLGLTHRQGSGLPWYPHRLFQSGDILLWYDPSDLTTMFKDTIGTQPVTADGDSVALMLDKGQWGGKSLTQVLAAQPELLVNGGFDADASWTKGTGWTINGGVASFNGASGATLAQALATAAGNTYEISFDLAGTGAVAVQLSSPGATSSGTLTGAGRKTVRLTANGNYANFAFSATAGSNLSVDNVSVKLIPGYHRTQATGTSMPKYKTGPNPAAAENSPELVTNGTFDTDTTGWVDSSVTSSGGTAVVASGETIITRGSARAEFYQIVTTEIGKAYRFSGEVTAKTGTASWWLGTTRNNASNLNISGAPVGAVTGTFIATATSTYVTVAADGTAGQTVTIDNVSVKEIPASAPYIHWLLYDGTDDSHATSGINWGTDEVAACVGLYKASDAAQACFAAFGTNGGTAGVSAEQGLILAPSAAAATTYYARFTGTLTPTQAVATGYAAPHTGVVSARGKIATDLQGISVNGDAEALGSGDMGTGNFGSAIPLHFGRRASTSIPFNGREYQTVIRSRLLSAAELSSLETFVAEKTGVIL